MAIQEIVTNVGRRESAVCATPDYSRPAVVTTLFFMGLSDLPERHPGPHLSPSSSDFARYARPVCVLSAYFLFSVPWSRVVDTIGYQRTMVIGLLTMAVGAILFVPAASAASYALFLTALVILAGGITGLQVSANPYVDLLGKPATASSRLDLTQAFNSLGTTLAPKIGGLLILSAAPLAIAQLRQLSPQALHAYRVQQAASVKLPYAVITIALILLAVLIGTFKLPKVETAERSGEKINDSVWKHRNIVLGGIGIFTYVGAEVSIGRFLVNYFGLPEIAGLTAKAAAGFVSFYWGGAMVGRFLGAALLRHVKAGSLLALCAIAGAILVTVSMLVAGHTAMWTILAVGFFNSIMFPTIFSLGVAELGPLTGTGSGILNMAIVGGAILPVLQGAIADRVGLHHAFLLPVVCYLFILFYGLSGSKPNSERYAKV